MITIFLHFCKSKSLSFTYGAYTSALALKNNQVNLLFLARLFVYSRKIYLDERICYIDN